MCEEVCIAPGEEDDTSQAMDHDIKKIARMITNLNELAFTRKLMESVMFGIFSKICV